MASSYRRRRSSEDSQSESDDIAYDRRNRCSRSQGRSRHRSISSTRHSKRMKITEEDIVEYMAKKALRKAEKAAKKLRSQNISGYVNDSNPFGDSNLNKIFVWGKKIERDIAQGVPQDAYSLKAEKKRQRERMAEIEKVKKRREERALERARHEEEMASLARERARPEFQDWEKKEEEFRLEQIKVRSEIRLREGRAKPIDILTKHLDHSDDLSIKISEPYMVFKGLTVKEMEELHEDIKLHLDLDRATPIHTQYWEALLLVCEWELAEARKKDALDRAQVHGEPLPPGLLAEGGIHSSIEADVKRFLNGRSFSQLEHVQSEVESKMLSGDAKVVEYWEAVLKHLHIFKAKASLKKIHANMLRKHLPRVEAPREFEEEEEKELSEEPEVNNPQILCPQEEIPEADELTGSYSPELFHGNDNEEPIDPEEDRAILERKRTAVLEERRLQEMAAKSIPSEDNFEKKALKAMGALEEGDAVFGTRDEINLDSQVYWWHDKYRPRKPKYFNRVHTGYEWNKYNQTHYDHDNPPPKTVQGYKFNIFYPDLVDKTKAPTYTIEKDGDNAETCIIKFHAGPPYEDIAFRIINKDWEYSHKKGFKCTFERGILHLYFNCKRYRYRR